MNLYSLKNILYSFIMLYLELFKLQKKNSIKAKTRQLYVQFTDNR